MRFLVVGDIHGGAKALQQVLDRAGFDPAKDLLISLGDIVDGWPQSFEVVDYLAHLPYCAYVIGNHDDWFMEYIRTGIRRTVWTSQGGQATLDSYKHAGTIPESHKHFLSRGSYYLDGSGYDAIPDFTSGLKRVFVHGGMSRSSFPALCEPQELMWDRSLIAEARKHEAGYVKDWRWGQWDEIFVGHTPVTFMGAETPQKWSNVWGMDTGGGWEGKLSIMDITTPGDYQFWQSDLVASLYPEARGRR